MLVDYTVVSVEKCVDFKCERSSRLEVFTVDNGTIKEKREKEKKKKRK